MGQTRLAALMFSVPAQNQTSRLGGLVLKLIHILSSLGKTVLVSSPWTTSLRAIGCIQGMGKAVCDGAVPLKSLLGGTMWKVWAMFSPPSSARHGAPLPTEAVNSSRTGDKPSRSTCSLYLAFPCGLGPATLNYSCLKRQSLGRDTWLSPLTFALLNYLFIFSLLCLSCSNASARTQLATPAGRWTHL